MNKHRVFVTVLIIILLLVSLGSSVNSAKAYGNSTITVNCSTLPMFITISATSDRPLTFAGQGQDYIVGYFRNLTSGDYSTSIFLPRRREVIAVGGSIGYIRFHYEATLRRSISPNDVYFLELLDLTGYVGYIKGVCKSSTTIRNSIPAGYTLKTVTCSTHILTSPSGMPLPTSMSPLLPEAIPEIGKQRYVLPEGVTGSDGVVYDKIQADAIRYGYFPRRCLS
jgi:hypothetical protein